ncbi:TMV resistance protein N-like [Neltuma alba]|uniref:TMV resistance protein N-like n=1 Tax=Neltuma alba TaxID=207710 RepID=UPI0010A3D771|nr:TMV resistance protein N-like [Prosopis alba]
MASSSPFSSSWTYDVFLNFRGPDTRRVFTAPLCEALRQSGIHAFMDDDIERGEEISASLEQAIERSRIAIVIFSPFYAYSRWCLDELLKIMECRRTQDQVVIPMFYNVDPSDVRKQRRTYGEQMKRHRQRWLERNETYFSLSFHGSEVIRWEEALTAVANIAGFDSANPHKSDLIKDIVEAVSEKLDAGQLFVVDHPVGIESRVHELTIEWSQRKPEKALIIGLWGMGGVGKTTVAKAIYNKIGR